MSPSCSAPNCLDWLLSCQHTKRHPFTGADPGGCGWSDLSGAVPDADDTPGAILANLNLRRMQHKRADWEVVNRLVSTWFWPDAPYSGS